MHQASLITIMISQRSAIYRNNELVHTANCSDGEIRLVGGSTNREGRVEVCVDGRWGTVCNNNPQLARTVCSQLGYPVLGR